VPIPAGVNRIVVVGHSPSGEIFNTGVWTFGDVPTTEALATAFAASARDVFLATAQAAMEFYLSPASGFDEIRTYHYPTGGPSASFLGVAPIASGAGTGTEADLPLQIAAVTSLRTGLPGRTRRGRMYWPVNRRTLANHQLDEPDVANIGGAVAGFLTGINAAAALGICTVVSQVGAGSHAFVTSVVVDSRLDVQRRRATDQTVSFSDTLAVS
jgi:hypothetical protein